MTRQERFETIWAAQHFVPMESLHQHRWITQDGYRDPAMAAHYRTFCNTLDSIMISLPQPDMWELSSEESLDMEPEEFEALESRNGAQWIAIEKCRRAIEAAGLKVD